MDGKRYAVETGRPQRRLKNQKGLQNINQSPDNKPGTEVSKRAYTARNSPARGGKARPGTDRIRRTARPDPGIP